MGYAEKLQAMERARGEKVLKNTSRVTMSTQSSAGGEVATGYGNRKMGYAEQLQAMERAKGEAALKNDALVVTRNQVEAGGGVVKGKGARKMGYAEQLQAMEKAKGDEVFVNSAMVTSRSGNHQSSSRVVVASGGRKQGNKNCRLISLIIIWPISDIH